MTDNFDFDLFVIGAGSGGVRAARVAAAEGARVAIAEEYRIGGTCVIRGCVPKKFLVYAADYGRALAEAEGYGWHMKNRRFDWPTLLRGVHGEVDRLSAIYERNLANSGVTIFRERAELAGAQELRLTTSGREIRAQKILIASGGKPWRPLDLPGQELAITSDDVFHLKTLPRSIVIAGGGYIALEFACIFNGLGVDTTLLYRGEKILRGFDADIRDFITAELQRLGIKLIPGDVFARIEKTADGLASTLVHGGRIGSDQVMLAIGRVPQTQNLGLERAGVQIDPAGAIIVDEWSKTTGAHCWAVGDVTNRLNLTPVAIREGQCFAETEFRNHPVFFDHRDVATAVFTRPPIGVVGLAGNEARAQFGAVDIYRTRFKPMKFALAGNGEQMLMKLVVRQSDQRVVGCHIAGIDAPEMIQLAAVAIKAGLTKAQFDATCAVHPTVAEELVTMRDKVGD